LGASRDGEEGYRRRIIKSKNVILPSRMGIKNKGYLRGGGEGLTGNKKSSGQKGVS